MIIFTGKKNINFKYFKSNSQKNWTSRLLLICLIKTHLKTVSHRFRFPHWCVRGAIGPNDLQDKFEKETPGV